MKDKRVARISEEVKRVMSDILINDLKDPRIKEMTTITNVEVTNDLSYARIYVSVLGNDEEKQETLDGLESAKGFIRKEISERVDLRHTPKPIFLLDESIEQGIHIAQIIADLNKGKDDSDE